MSKKKYEPYSDPRWNGDTGTEVTGYVEFTEEEKKKNKKEFREFLKKKGILKDED